jgi:hypothetical protein
VPFNMVAAIAQPDMIASRGSHGRACQFGKGSIQQIDVAVGLLQAPLPAV